MVSRGCGRLEKVLDLVVQYEYESTTGTTENVGEGSLEEGAATLGLGDRGPAVSGALVQDVGLGTTGLHHHAPTHGVEGIGDDTGDGGHTLRNTPGNEEWSLLGVGKHATSGVVEAEVRGTVDNDTLDGYTESSVQSSKTVSLEDLGQAVAKTRELTLSTGFTDIGSQPGSGEVEWVDEAQGSGSGGATRGEITKEITSELGVLVDSSQEDLLVLVFEGEVQRLCGEVTDDVGEVTAPEAEETLFFWDAHEAINHTPVALVLGDLLGDVLDLEQQLDALDWSYSGLGDCGGNTTSDEVLGKRHGIRETRHFVCWVLV